MKETFKSGDKVYYPTKTNRIVKLESSLNETYPMRITNVNGITATITNHGLGYIHNITPSIFHATKENHKKLVELYGIKFEEPVKVKSPKEVIQAMLDDGWKYVPCFVSDIKVYPDTTCDLTLVKSIKDNGLFRDTSKLLWTHATPFDAKTGKLIIDYLNGQIVTE